MEIKEINFNVAFTEATNLNFDKYYTKYYNKLSYYIRKFGINEMDADALANDTFIQAIQKIHTYDNSYSFTPWLFKIAKNLTLKHLKDSKNTILVDYNQEQDEDFGSSYNALKFHINKKIDEFSDDSSSDRITELKYHETLKEIQKLGPKYKNIVILRDIDGKSYDDIAEMLGISLQTVKNRLHHGRLKLEKSLKPKFKEIYQEY